MSHVLGLLFDGFLGTVWEVLVALIPIVAIFLLLNITAFHMKKRPFRKIITGFVITFVGLVFFMQGVHIAFNPVGTHLGTALAALEYNWILIPIGFAMGFLVAFAEPAVHVMINQVEDLTSGAIRSTVMLMAISIGVAGAVALAMTKLIFGLSLWWFIAPGYLIIFILSRFVDPTFIAIAFDNGGVATGPMCSTFILALSVAAANTIPNRDPLLDGFGVVALIAMAPILTTMLLSFAYKTKSQKRAKGDASLVVAGASSGTASNTAGDIVQYEEKSEVLDAGERIMEHIPQYDGDVQESASLHTESHAQESIDIDVKPV